MVLLVCSCIDLFVCVSKGSVLVLLLVFDVGKKWYLG